MAIAADDSRFFRDEETVDPGDVTYVYPEITERGDYELSVDVDDRGEKVFPFDVEAYDLGMGSNLDVWINDDDVRIGMEE